jgi:hypothetical protein
LTQISRNSGIDFSFCSEFSKVGLVSSEDIY